MSSFGEPYDPNDPTAHYEKLEAVHVEPFKKSSPKDPKPPEPRVSHRRKEGPSQGDVVLLQFLSGGNRPDLAQEGGYKVLRVTRSPPGREDRPEEDPDTLAAMEIERQATERRIRAEAERKEKEKMSTAHRALFGIPMYQTPSPPLGDLDVKDPSSSSLTSSAPPVAPPTPVEVRQLDPHEHGLKLQNINGSATRLRSYSISKDPLPLPPHTATFSKPKPPLVPRPRRQSLQWPSQTSHSELAARGLAQHLKEPPTPSHKLPAINPTSPPARGPLSPPAHETLPGVGPLLDLAKQSDSRSRQLSITSMNGVSPSPTMFSSASPATTLNYGTSPDSATSPRDFAHRPQNSAVTSPGWMPPSFSAPRRHSQASEMFSSLTSASSATSPSTFSPDTQTGTTITTPSERGGPINGSIGGPIGGMDARRPSLSISGGPAPLSLTLAAPSPNPGPLSAPTPPSRPFANGNTLPPLQPPPSASAIHSIPPPSGTGYRCDHPGCNAAPFQTQYLLNSHTTVHSSSRPHYCPVQGCPRSVTGQGFKRKNEMIRHQLVHDSPGYVCPFCPEREHRYPRPDNLQRHVRVHHGDVQTNDPQLRAVLERKAGGRGAPRRRRGVS